LKPRLPEAGVEWAQAARLVPSRYRPSDCFERIAEDPETQDLQIRLADFTASGMGDLAAQDPSRILFGPGAGWINACYLVPRPGRFSTARQGAFYAARELATSLAEVRYHLELSYRTEGIQEAQDLEYRALRVHLAGTFHDLRSKARTRAPWSAVYDPVSYAASQALAGQERAPAASSGSACATRAENAAQCSIPAPSAPAATTPTSPSAGTGGRSRRCTSVESLNWPTSETFQY
jgi:hypothetical protein